MSQTQSSSRKRPYGLQRVCRGWQFPRSTVNEHRRRAALNPEERPEPKKRGPQGPCTDDQLAEKIRELLKASPFHGEGYRKMWAQLRKKGTRTSPDRVRRVMGDGHHMVTGLESAKKQALTLREVSACVHSSKTGGSSQNRTADTGIFSPLLYQLS